MPTPAVVPLPASIARRGAPFPVTAETAIAGDADAAAHLRTLLAARTGAAPGSATGSGSTGTIALTIAPGGAPESYRLTADATAVTVTGADAAGLFYGIQTLGQLLTKTTGTTGTPAGWEIPAVEIDDAPRFAYRGVMLDVARHFHGVDTVKAFIDRAASLKFNALHLHLTDDQGWRLELRSRPELTAKASSTSVGGDPGGFFTQDDYREIIAYAAARHLIVVPEIDLPGHTHAISLAYPELSEEPVISDQVREIIRRYGGELPVHGRPFESMAVGFSSLKIHDEATSAFLADVLGELAELTPGPYLHLGGDECLGTSPEDFAAFMQRVTTLVAGLGKTPITWHEAGAATDLAPTTVGQYWGFVSPVGGMDEKARAFVRGGAQLILSPADAIYLDMKFDADSPLGLTWARGVTTAQRAYEWDPARVIEGVGDAGILGVEAPLWTETVRDLGDIDALVFPRVAAAAEAGWSPAPGSAGRTWESFRARVGALGPLWTSLGIGFTPLPEIDWATD
ncbi:beta-N-acetylhexosaminidase [Microbacterium sp.]|uniref:beta-N-acetylhexosaminidase n=1 Tax=Microbacterium sp. TaxID=51671 RepID=UPI0039E29E63